MTGNVSRLFTVRKIKSLSWIEILQVEIDIADFLAVSKKLSMSNWECWITENLFWSASKESPSPLQVLPQFLLDLLIRSSPLAQVLPKASPSAHLWPGAPQTLHILPPHTSPLLIQYQRQRTGSAYRPARRNQQGIQGALQINCQTTDPLRSRRIFVFDNVVDKMRDPLREVLSRRTIFRQQRPAVQSFLRLGWASSSGLPYNLSLFLIKRITWSWQTASRWIFCISPIASDWQSKL